MKVIVLGLLYFLTTQLTQLYVLVITSGEVTPSATVHPFKYHTWSTFCATSVRELLATTSSSSNAL